MTITLRGFLVLGIFILANVSVTIGQNGDIAIPGSTIAIVNFRSGPGSAYDVLAELPNETPVHFVGRNSSSTWLLADVDGQRGWISYTFIQIDGRVSDLPVAEGGALTTTAQPQNVEAPLMESAPAIVQSGPSDALGGVTPQITNTSRRIFLEGRALGNRPDIFAKIGDSITATDLFLDPIGQGGLQLHDYAYLQGVVSHFSQSIARDHNSFANTSLAARGGWSSSEILNPAAAPGGICRPGETPLACEYRTLNPAVALIMLGTNDLPWMASATYAANMRQIVEYSISRGVIPVLSTIPDQPGSPNAGRVGEFNQIIAGIAAQYDIPLWNYWLALQGLPNQGLGGDNVHPSYDWTTGETGIFSNDALRYGFNMRNLTALMVLDVVWRGAMY